MFNEDVTVLYSTNANIHIYHEQIDVIDLFLFNCSEKILSTMHTIFARCSHICQILYYLFLNKNRLFCVFIGFEPTCDGNQQVRKCMTRISSYLNATMLFLKPIHMILQFCFAPGFKQRSFCTWHCT